MVRYETSPGSSRRIWMLGEGSGTTTGEPAEAVGVGVLGRTAAGPLLTEIMRSALSGPFWRAVTAAPDAKTTRAIATGIAGQNRRRRKKEGRWVASRARPTPRAAPTTTATSARRSMPRGWRIQPRMFCRYLIPAMAGWLAARTRKGTIWMPTNPTRPPTLVGAGWRDAAPTTAVARITRTMAVSR